MRVLLLAAASFGIASAKAATLRWDWEYTASSLPEQSRPGILFHGTPEGRRIEGGALHLVNASTHDGPCAVYVIRDIGALNSRGVTLEARLRLSSSGGEHYIRPGLQLFIADSHCAEAVLVCDGYVETRYSLMRHDMDTRGGFHVYRLTARGDDFRVYVDGELAVNGYGRYLGTRTNQHRLTWLDTVRFGAGSKYTQAEGEISLLRYSTAGAFAPDGAVDTLGASPDGGRKVEIAPVRAVREGMAAGLNGYDPALPSLGQTVRAPVLHDGPEAMIWLQNATTKVFRRDVVKATAAGTPVAVSLARNEYEPFQLVLQAKTRGLRGVRVEFSDMEGQGAKIGREHLTARPVAYLKIPPDDVTTSRGKKLGRAGNWPDGLLPYERFDVEHPRINYPVWVTVYCPAGTPPGDYRGTVTAGGEGMASVSLPLHVKVRAFTLPRTPRLNNQFLFNNVYHSVEKSMEAYKRMYREMAAHRGSPSRLFPGLKVEIHDGAVWIDPENEKFVEMARFCIDELGVQRFWCPHIGPHQMIGWFESNRKGRVFMGVPMYEDRPPYTTFTPAFERRLVDYLSKLSSFLRSKGLFEHFNCLTSHNEPACPPAWRSTPGFELEARYCDLVHQADPEYRVFMNMALVVGEPELSTIKDKVSIWAENTLASRFKLDDRVGFIPPSVVQERKRAGDEVQMYRNSHDYIDIGPGSSAVSHRANGWIMWVTGTTGYYFDNGGISASLWNAGAWRKIGRAWWGQTQWGAGDQMYPDENMSGFCSSIRFELNREGYEDYEYLATLSELDARVGLTEEQRETVRGFEERIVPLYCWWRKGGDPDAFWEEGVYEGSFSEDPPTLHEARERLGEMIDAIARRAGLEM